MKFILCALLFGSISTARAALEAASATTQTYGTLCYTSEKGIRRSNKKPEPTVELTVDEKHVLALEATNLVYKLADLESALDGKTLLAKQSEFVHSLPEGYTIQHHRSDPLTGLKYAVLQPLKKGWPWILAFAGTETGLDMMSDLSLGLAQLESLTLLRSFFAQCEVNYENYEPLLEINGPLGSQNWIITGHSLGGGLAQAFAFYTQLHRKNLFLDPAQIEVVTFNSFGVDEQLEVKAANILIDTARMKQQVLSSIQSSHYYVTGDLISRIGTHIGPTYELRREMLPNSLEDITHRHILSTINEIVLKDPLQSFTAARLLKGKPAQLIAKLAKAGQYFKALPKYITNSEDQKIQMLTVIEQAYKQLNQSKVCDMEFKSSTIILSSMTEILTIDMRMNMTPRTSPLMAKLSAVVRASVSQRPCKVGADLRAITGLHIPNTLSR